MATTRFCIKQPSLFLVLKSQLKRNPLSSSQYYFQQTFSNPHKTPNRPTPFTAFKSFFTTPALNNNNNDIRKDGISVSAMEIVENPLEKFANVMHRALKTLQKPAVADVLVGSLLIHNPNYVLAASGGRMGGGSFSNSRSSSSNYPVRSSSSGSWSVPYSAPYYYRSRGSGGGSNDDPSFGAFHILICLVFLGFGAFIFSSLDEDGHPTATDKTCVLKLQVAVSGLGKSLQKDLNRIAERADTSKKEGLSYVLTETCLALLRHPDYCISAYSSAEVKRSMEEGEERFNQLSIEERGKFDEETLVNVNNIKRKSKTVQKASGFSNEYIVVTILVAAEGVHKLPTVNGNSNLKEALQTLAAFPSSKTLAVEVLWTPQSETDTLSENELLEDYPLLRPL